MKATVFFYRMFTLLALMGVALSSFSVTPARAQEEILKILYAKPAGTGDCSTWAKACTLQTALAQAVSGNQIWVKAGKHKPTTGNDRNATFQLKSGVSVYGGFVGTETMITQRDFVYNITILSGDLLGNDNHKVHNNEPTRADNSLHVVTGANTAKLDGFTITGGNANVDSDTNHQSGGGMINISSNPLLTNIIFEKNSALLRGGAMYNSGSNPTLFLVSFEKNYTDGVGGGIANFDNSSPNFKNIALTNNIARVDGGGIGNQQSTLVLTNSKLIGNRVIIGDGGGMSNLESNVTLSNVTFNQNTSPQGYGGGMAERQGSAKLTNVIFTENTAPTSRGGGLHIHSPKNTVLNNITFFKNSAIYGGGMSIYGRGTNTVAVTNVTFKNNTSVETGGGMNIYDGNATLTNVTFANNASTRQGGGIHNEGQSNTKLRNVILWGNTAPTGAQINNADSTASITNSVIQGGYAGGQNIITADPKLGALGSYGGFTPTIPLLSGSSAIDTGNDSVCHATDQRGISRPQGAHCDIGAYEAE